MTTAHADFETKPLVYLAGPYTQGDPVENTGFAIETAEHLMQRIDVTVLVPHLSLLWQLRQPHDYDWWIEYDLQLLARCDALFRLQGPSSGSDGEVNFALTHGIPVFADPHYRDNVNSLREWARTWEDQPRG